MPAINLPGITSGGRAAKNDDDTDQPFADEEAPYSPPTPPPPPTTTTTAKNSKAAAAATKTKKKKSKRSDSSGLSLFPNPKQVVTIFSPIVHTIAQEIDPASNEPLLTSPRSSVLSSYVDGVWKGFTTGTPGDTLATTATTAAAAAATAKRGKKRIIKVKMGTLIVKMLNRLVRDKVVAYDRVFVSRNATHLIVRILASERTVPVLLMRCERIGVGSVVGAAFGTELEWSMVPSVTEEMQEEAIGRAAAVIAGDGAGAGAGAGGHGGGELAGPFSLDRLKFGGGGGGGVMDEDNVTGANDAVEYEQGFKVTMDKELKDMEEEDEVVSISSEDDVDDGPSESPERNTTTRRKKSVRAKDTVRAIVGGMNKKNADAAEDSGEDPAGSAPRITTKAGADAVKIGDVEILSSERKAKLGQAIADAREEWLETGSRLRVLQVMESVEAGASLTFDYLAYVLLAAWVAAMGLINNSVAVVVASMLLSPLMGPCLGATLGFTLKKPSLIKLGFANECISLILCILVGMFVGVIAVAAGTPSVQNWPSGEMTSRGSATGLVSGMFIAIPSGMGVALSVLGRNSGGLTGVAISLSLLPPAVNAGICWMAAALYRTGAATRNSGDTTDYAFVGSFSLLLTLVNIACVSVWAASLRSCDRHSVVLIMFINSALTCTFVLSFESLILFHPRFYRSSSVVHSCSRSKRWPQSRTRIPFGRETSRLPDTGARLLSPTQRRSSSESKQPSSWRRPWHERAIFIQTPTPTATVIAATRTKCELPRHADVDWLRMF